MELSWELLGWIIAFLVPLGVGVIALNEFRVAKTCFALSAVVLCAKVAILLSQMQMRPYAWMLITFSLFGVIGLCLVGAIRWVDMKRPSPPSATREPPSSPASQQPRDQPQPRESPITKTDRFATLVPIVPTWANSPIPMDTNVQDPHHDFYSDLLGLAGRPDKQPEGWPPYQDRRLETDSGTAFAMQLIQYYVFKSIYFLHRGTSGWIKWTAGVGVTPIERAAITPPDATPYGNERVLKMLSDSEFLRPADKMLWTFDNGRLQVPKGTKVSFIDHPGIPEKGKMPVRSVRFERPKYYRLDFDVSPGVGANNQMPAGFVPTTVPGVTTWTIMVAMHYEIERRNEDGFTPELYSAWADALFDGLKKKMGF
jgi:hypothetical protein